MNIDDQLLVEHSKMNAQLIASYIGNDPKKFKKLFLLVIKNEKIISQRAAYVMDQCLDNHPRLIIPFLDQLIANLSVPNQHNSIIRSSLRILQAIQIPEHLQAPLFDICLNFIRNEQEPIAIRAFSMTAALNIARIYPELLIELKNTLIPFIHHESPSLKSRSSNTLAAIEKII